MASHEIQCPSCGHTSQDPDWCDNCGAPLEAESATHAASSKEWLEPGDTLTIKCRIDRLLPDLVNAEGVAQLEIELEDLLESSSVRHICRARIKSIIEVKSETPIELLDKALSRRRFTVEEIGALLGSRGEELPEELSPLVRIPAGESEHNEHLVRLFREDGSSTLEEYLFNAQGKIDYNEVKEIFTSLLDLSEDLHERGYLYLRLSPWTLRVISGDPSRPGGSRHEGEITEVEDDEEHPPPSDTDVASPDELGLDLKAVEAAYEESIAEEDAPDDGQTSAAEEDPDGGSDEPDGAQEPPSALSGTDAFEDEDEEEEEEKAEEEPAAPVIMKTLPGLAPLSYDLEEISVPQIVEAGARAGIERALLDGGFRFYRAQEEYQEVPVVVGFSPPEMFGRSRAEIGTHCDIFSLGMLLYFLIAGELPPTSIYTRHIPAVPSRHFRPDFPMGLQTIISRATRPAPSERYADVSSMRVAFERACELIEQRIDSMQDPEPPRIEQAVEKHIGIGKRLRNPTNQDNVFGAKSKDGRFSLLVVADGVSTASFGSGDLASDQMRDVAEERWPEILEQYTQRPHQLDEFQIIFDLMKEANQRIIDHVNLHHFPFRGTPHEVMGTTAMVAIINNGIVTLGSLGDSRAYLQRGTSFEQVTIDHNLWTLSILEGASADNALSLPHGDALARCLGTFMVEDHKLDAIAPQPDIFRFPIMSGDTLLMTTDGLIDFGGANTLASEDNILSIMLAEPNPALACLELILLANRGGGGDNIGMAIAKFI